MNLYIRFFLTIIKALLPKNKINLTDKGIWKGRVLLNDIDIYGHMNNGRYLTLFGLAAFDVIMKSGLLLSTFKNKYMYIFDKTNIQFYKSLRLFEKYIIETQLVYWEGQKGYVESVVINQKKEIVARGTYRVVLKSPMKKDITWQKIMNVLYLNPPEVVGDVPEFVFSLNKK